jgi:hypothetical protein
VDIKHGHLNTQEKISREQLEKSGQGDEFYPMLFDQPYHFSLIGLHIFGRDIDEGQLQLLAKLAHGRLLPVADHQSYGGGKAKAFKVPVYGSEV